MRGKMKKRKTITDDENENDKNDEGSKGGRRKGHVHNQFNQKEKRSDDFNILPMTVISFCCSLTSFEISFFFLLLLLASGEHS